MLGDFKVSVGPSIVGKSAWHLESHALVKLLSLAPHHRLHRERALELLWPGTRRRPPRTTFARPSTPPAESSIRQVAPAIW